MHLESDTNHEPMAIVYPDSVTWHESRSQVKTALGSSNMTMLSVATKADVDNGVEIWEPYNGGYRIADAQAIRDSLPDAPEPKKQNRLGIDVAFQAAAQDDLQDGAILYEAPTNEIGIGYYPVKIRKRKDGSFEKIIMGGHMPTYPNVGNHEFEKVMPIVKNSPGLYKQVPINTEVMREAIDDVVPIFPSGFNGFHENYKTLGINASLRDVDDTEIYEGAIVYVLAFSNVSAQAGYYPAQICTTSGGDSELKLKLLYTAPSGYDQIMFHAGQILPIQPYRDKIYVRVQ